MWISRLKLGLFLGLVLCEAPSLAQDESGRIYIAVGDPNLKKVLMAVDRTQGGGSEALAFYSTLVYDMDFSDLFEILPETRLPDVGSGITPNTFKIEPYKVLGVEFLIKSALTKGASGWEAEVRLYDVNRGLQIMGRRYPLVTASNSPGRELAHFAANDILKTLTGEAGVFRTRILMSCGDRTKEIYIMDFDGQNVRRLTRDGNFALSSSWAPDGQRILFTSYRPASRGGPLNPNLYSFNVNTRERKVLSAAPGLNTGGAFHPLDNKIAYTFSRRGKAEIFVLDLVSNTRTNVTETSFFSVEPSWSPDGKRLTFSSSKTGKPHIYVANADGTSPVRLTFAGQYNSSPNWSPKGNKIVFAGQENRANNFNVFMVDPNGSNLIRLTDGRHSSENPVFSPDGRFLAFSSNEDGRYRIWTMTARGTRIRALSPKGLGDCKQPAWSPRL